MFKKKTRSVDYTRIIQGAIHNTSWIWHRQLIFYTCIESCKIVTGWRVWWREEKRNRANPGGSTFWQQFTGHKLLRLNTSKLLALILLSLGHGSNIFTRVTLRELAAVNDCQFIQFYYHHISNVYTFF